MEQAEASGLGSFVGRRAELAKLDALASARERIVVVTGPAGVGKSRLVRQWAQRGPVVRADLSTARDLEDALRRIARALEIEVESGEREAIERIGAALRSRASVRLWLDDADAVIEALAQPLARWTEAGPSAVLTSRRAMIALPHATIALAPLAPDEALALLVARARAVRPDFAPSPAQRESLAGLIARLDALPLAIELVAPRLRLLSPRQLLDRLESTTARDALHDALERSFELLRPYERDALAQSSVFRDGFTLEAAEAVIDLAAHANAPDVLTVLESLVAQSLLRTETVPDLPDEVRIRHFGVVLERAKSLLDQAAIGPLHRRHARHYLAAAERWDAGIESAEERECTARLIVELPNLEAAYERATEAEIAARLALVLHMAYQRRGPFARQLELTERALALASQTDSRSLRGRAELAVARVHRWRGALAAADASLGRALAHAVAASDVALEASCARNLAASRFRAGDLQGFGRHLEHALEAAMRSGRVSDEVNARNGLGYLFAERGEIDRAQAELERALALARTTAIPGLLALVHGSLSALMLRAERFAAVEHHASEAIAAYESLGYLRQWALEHLARGRARLARGLLEEAKHDGRAALERTAWLGLPVARPCLLLGAVAFAERDYALARDHVERALTELHDDEPDAQRAWTYAAAARAMLGHREAAREAAQRSASPVADHFVALADALAAAARGEPAVAPSPPVGRSDGDERRLLAQAAAIAAEHLESASTRLEIARDARWFRLEGNQGVDLTRRRPLRGILRALVDRRRAAPGEPLSVDGVLEAGWPGERMSPESGARRVYVTINRLRALGLNDVLLTTGDGYMLAPAIKVEEVAEY